MTEVIDAQTDSPAAMMACLNARHAQARKELDTIGERADSNAVRFDMAQGAEIALNNAIMVLQDDASYNPLLILTKAGMSLQAAAAMSVLEVSERRRYEKDDALFASYQALLDEDLATNISSHFPGGSYGIMLNHAGTIIKRLAG